MCRAKGGRRWPKFPWDQLVVAILVVTAVVQGIVAVLSLYDRSGGDVVIEEPASREPE